MHTSIANSSPKNIRSLIIFNMMPRTNILPLSCQSKVNKKKLLLFWGTRRAKQEVLRLHITMDIPFRVHLFQYGDCLYTYACNHLNRHRVGIIIPNIP
uniref:Uncharacterized protein n=1 Tax=Zea mays TaxID=4577 RepID=C4J1Q0_MAIZE|nr:unknown [Zea mays]